MFTLYVRIFFIIKQNAKSRTQLTNQQRSQPDQPSICGAQSCEGAQSTIECSVNVNSTANRSPGSMMMMGIPSSAEPSPQLLDRVHSRLSYIRRTRSLVITTARSGWRHSPLLWRKPSRLVSQCERHTNDTPSTDRSSTIERRLSPQHVASESYDDHSSIQQKQQSQQAQQAKANTSKTLQSDEININTIVWSESRTSPMANSEDEEDEEEEEEEGEERRKKEKETAIESSSPAIQQDASSLRSMKTDQSIDRDQLAVNQIHLRADKDTFTKRRFSGSSNDSETISRLDRSRVTLKTPISYDQSCHLLSVKSLKHSSTAWKRRWCASSIWWRLCVCRRKPDTSLVRMDPLDRPSRLGKPVQVRLEQVNEQNNNCLQTTDLNQTQSKNPADSLAIESNPLRHRLRRFSFRSSFQSVRVGNDLSLNSSLRVQTSNGRPTPRTGSSSALSKSASASQTTIPAQIGTSSSTATGANNPANNASSHTKALYTTLIILGTYLVCWMPALCFLVLTCVDGCPYPLFTLSIRKRVILSFINNSLVIIKSMVDPFIYIYRMKEVKNALRRSGYWLFGNLNGNGGPGTRSSSNRRTMDRTLNTGTMAPSPNVPATIKSTVGPTSTVATPALGRSLDKTRFIKYHTPSKSIDKSLDIKKAECEEGESDLNCSSSTWSAAKVIIVVDRQLASSSSIGSFA